MKIYSIKYTDNTDLPYARTPIEFNGSTMASVAVAFPTEGSIARLVVKQTFGTPCDCKIRLLDSQIPYPPGDYPAGTAPLDDIELYEIITQQTVNSGTALLLIHEEYGFPYHNQDGTFTDNQRYIYVIIEPQAAASNTGWSFAITARTDVG